jgi:cell division protein FtsB
MANQALIAQLQQLAGQLNALQQTIGNLQASNTTLTTRIATLDAENTTLTATNRTLTAQVANLSGGAAAGSTARGSAGTAPGIAGGGAGADPLVTFASTPAMVNHQDLINYSTKVGRTIYNEGCEKLTTEFDMKSSGTAIYTTEIQAKCVKMGWHMGTQQIINFTNAAGFTINIVNQYGQITTATLQAQCEVFCKSTGTLFQARARSNNMMMSKCIMKTLTPAAKVRLFPFQGDYKIDNVIYASLLHKKIMALATTILVAITKTLCSNLRELPTYCSTIKGYIKLLHSYFNSNYTQIIPRGATFDDPINTLFSVYKVVPCHNFRNYIKRKQDAHMDGTLTLMHKELIMLATNKFNLLKQEGMWRAKSPDKDKIVAMQAKLTALKGQFQLAPNLKKAVGAKDDYKVGDKKQGGGDNKKMKNKKKNANKREQKKDENWKKTPPKEEEAHKKEVKGRTWHWCKHHMAWGNHKEENCRLGKDCTSQQKSGINQVAAQAASATIINSEWQALMANMACNMAND